MRYIIVFCYLISSCCFAQHSIVQDSISDRHKLDANLQKALGSYDFDTALGVSDSIENYSRVNKDSAFLAYAFQIKAEIYKYKSDLPSAKRNLQIGLDILKELGDTSAVINLNCSLSSIYRLEGKLDSSSLRLDIVRPLLRYNSDTIVEQYYYNQRSVVYESIGRLDSAIFYIFKRVSITGSKNSYARATAYIQLANLFHKVEDFNKALHYADEAIIEIEKNKIPLRLTKIKAHITKIRVLLDLGKTSEARKLAEESLSSITDEGYDEYRAVLKIILSSMDYEDGKTTVISRDIIENKQLSSGILLQFYTLRLKQAQRIEKSEIARQAVIKCDSLIPNVGYLDLKREYFEVLTDYWKSKGDFEKGLDSQSKFLKINSEINNQTNAYRTYDLESKYQLENKEIQLQLKQKEIENKTLITNYALVLSLLLFLAAIGLFLYFKERQRKKNEQLSALQKQSQISTLESLIEGEEKERLRIAQELHDGLNGDLSAIKFKLNELTNANALNVREVVDMIDKSCEQVRTISHNLVPPALQNFDLYIATSDYCQKMNLNYAPEIEFQYLGVKQTLPKSIEINMYRIAQELVTNSLKHSKATSIDVQLSTINDILQLTVEDNGVGYVNNEESVDGIGLSNIRSRVKYLNGELDIVSNNKGTSTSVSISVNKNND